MGRCPALPSAQNRQSTSGEVPGTPIYCPIWLEVVFVEELNPKSHTSDVETRPCDSAMRENIGTEAQKNGTRCSRLKVMCLPNGFESNAVQSRQVKHAVFANLAAFWIFGQDSWCPLWNTGRHLSIMQHHQRGVWLVSNVFCSRKKWPQPYSPRSIRTKAWPWSQHHQMCVGYPEFEFEGAYIHKGSVVSCPGCLEQLLLIAEFLQNSCCQE